MNAKTYGQLPSKNELVWQAVDAIKAAREQLETARTNIVLAGLGSFTLKMQKRMMKLDSELTKIKITVAKQVGTRINTSNQ